MKSRLLLFLLAITFNCFSQKTKGIVYYAKKSSPIDLAKTSELDLQGKDMLVKMQENLVKLEYTLKFINQSALFEENKQMDVENSLNIKMARIMSGVNGVFFYKNSYVTRQFEFAGQQFLIESKFNINDWKLTNEKIKIEGYICYKAIKKEKIEGSWGSKDIDVIAWYCPEIPINFGPDGYAGLPGLIMQLEKGKIITFLKKIVYTDENIDIVKPTKGKKVKQEELDAIAKQMSLNRRSN